MAKFRSKLKKKVGSKRWARGTASSSNPETNKHRAKAKGRFFQSNLSLAPAPAADGSPASRLTLEAVLKHDAVQSYSGGAKADKGGPTVNDIAESMRSFSMNEILEGADGMTESQLGTFKTFQTFASNYSACSNMSFKKLLNNFRADSQLQKDMLAILAALTEVLKEKGGGQSSTEYFLALMETIEATKEENDTVAAVSLLAMGIKSVPEAVLRKKFSETAQSLLSLLERFAETDNQNVMRSVIGCLSVLLRAQEYSQWKLSSTVKFLDAILAFVIHSKPKVRKAAQHAVVAIIHGSCFMLPPKPDKEEDEDKMCDEEPTKLLVKCHPIGGRVAKFCVGQFSPENIANNQTVVLHTLGLLHNALAGFSKDDIKLVAESLLSIMTATNVLIRTNCFQTFHSLFSSRTENLTPPLAGKLLAALYDYRPDKSDCKQIIAWLAVLKEGHLFLAKHNLTMCSSALPRFVEICVRDFWGSDKMEVVSAASNSLKDILYECVQPCCEDEEVEKHRVPTDRVLKSIAETLNSAPFGHASNQVLIIMAISFDIAGKHFGETLAPALKTLGNRYDPQSSSRIQVEHAVLQAIGSMDTGLVLQCIPLAEESGKIDLERTWLLPLLREGLNQSRLEIFNNVILKLAYQCYMLWNKFKESDNKHQAHIFELLSCQLWGLFPGFCRRPKDVTNFRLIAKTLGTVLNENADFRAPILDGLKELIIHLESDSDKAEVGKYAKNFLPRLFNIYTTKPKGSYENEVRQTTFETIKAFLSITPRPILEEMHSVAVESMTSKAPGTFIYDMLFDIVEQLSLYQSAEKLDDIYQRYITAILKRDKTQETVAKTNANVRRQMKKAFKLLREILASDNGGCVEFVQNKRGNIEKLLLGTLHSTFDGIQAPRLACLKLMIEKNPDSKIGNKIITRTVPEAIASYNVEAVKQENLSNDLIEMVGNMYNSEGKINEFVDMLIAGFTGDSALICNTIWVLKNVLQTFTGTLKVDTLRFMLEQVLTFVVGNNRSEVDAALNFLLIYIKILPIPLVTNYLALIVKALSKMVADTKRHCRLIVGYTLTRLCKRFGADEIVKLVPGNDETTHKRLKKIRKDLARAKRNKLEDSKKKRKGADSDDDDDVDDELAGHLEKKSLTIDDILADSDSDSDSGVEDEKKARKKMNTFIKESPDNIVDLADLDAISKITTSRPMDQSEPGTSEQGRKAFAKKKDANRGFATASDGRLIIEDIEDYSDSDEDPDENVGYKDKAKKRVYDQDDSDSDDDEDDKKEAMDEDEGPSRKRKAMEAMSMRSGMSGYVAGGKGIHRPVAASVKSGYSSKSVKSNKSARTAKSYASTGTEYKSKKAQGDMLKKGKHEPYAYVPLSRNSLNRRKRAKNSGQFKSIVKGARKGAAAGAKNRLLKKSGGSKKSS
ncbi:RRP12-like protein [Uranotaenia lowii]|uniref:RRP12-like protein n=1 Tax=Uranotaenia lowii TaxID=190385 RepID=UPI0024787938|nr:RRP12-like protein [Uranotaenia lowii]XP_055612833.1 RRP12-like protein [Uranotaenia lowii]XP_055612834.1 RRP12-like protein [Uranotaenia lowii]